MKIQLFLHGAFLKNLCEILSRSLHHQWKNEGADHEFPLFSVCIKFG